MFTDKLLSEQTRETTPGTSPILFLLAAIVIFLANWAVLSFPFLIDEVSNELLFLEVDASDELKNEAYVRIQASYWKNLLFNFTIAGIVFGVFCQFAVYPTQSSWAKRIQAISLGLVCGATAGTVGTCVRYYFDVFIIDTYSLSSIASDIVVMSVTSVILALPLAFVSKRFAHRVNVPITVSLGAATGGALTPVFIAVATSSGLISSFSSTESFPLSGAGPNAIWMLTLLVSVILAGFRPALRSISAN